MFKRIRAAMYRHGIELDVVGPLVVALIVVPAIAVWLNS